MSNESPEYITYLLRLWCAGSAEEPSWRAALLNPTSGERQVFGDLASLFAFLEERTGSVSPIAVPEHGATSAGPEEAHDR